jgi:polysaccharide biosynthesis transport protein
MNRIAAIALRHCKYLILFNILVLAATGIKVAKSSSYWTANAQLIMPDTTSNLDANLGPLGSLKSGNPAFSVVVNPLKVQTSILTSDALMEQVLQVDPEKKKFSRLAKYKSLFEVTPGEQSTTILLAVTGSSPKLARQRATNLINLYQQRLNELRQADSESRAQFSKKPLEQAQQRLIQAQEALARFQASSGLVNSEEQTKGLVTTLSNLSTAQAQTQAQARASENQVRALSERLGLTPNQAILSLSLAENKEYQFVRAKLTEIETKLAEIQSSYTANHPKVQNLLLERDELQRQLERYITQSVGNAKVETQVGSNNEGRGALIQQLILAESTVSAQQRQAAQLQSQIDQLNQSLKLIPINQARLLELRRQYEVAEGVYRALVAQTQQVKIDSFNAYPNIQVLNPPAVDPKPTGPKLKLIVIGGLMASLLGSIALAVLLESRDPLLSPNQLQSRKFPIVISIPRLKPSPGVRHLGMELALGSDTDIEFQRLASVISLQPLKDPRLLITSAIEGEGKTTVTLGLAKALVGLGFRVLLVDGDFRQAQLSRCLVYEQKRSSADRLIQLQSRLDLLPTSVKQGNIAELVTQGQFEQSLAAAQSASSYDYILIDSAPVSLTSETALMAAIIPNVLLVVRPELSKRNSVNDSLNQLAQHHAQILGLVVNGVETKSRPYLSQSDDSFVKS